MSDANIRSVEQLGAKDELPLALLFQALEGYRVVIDTHDHVRAYLKRFPGLIAHVLPTVERARQEFGDAAELTLTINDDPESYDPYLKVYISLPSYGPETMSRMLTMAGFEVFRVRAAPSPIDRQTALRVINPDFQITTFSLMSSREFALLIYRRNAAARLLFRPSFNNRADLA